MANDMFNKKLKLISMKNSETYIINNRIDFFQTSRGP